MADNQLDKALGVQINLALFPTRVKDKKVTAKAAKGLKSSSDVGRATSYVPIADNAYARTLRYHEGLHQIHSEKSLSQLYTHQAVEDARLHLICSKSKGQVRRDEVYSALLELRNIDAFRGTDAQVESLVRSAAILRRGSNEREKKQWVKAVGKVTNALRLTTRYDVEKTSYTKPYEHLTEKEVASAIKKCLEAIEADDIDAARKAISYYITADATKPQGGADYDDGIGDWLESFKGMPDPSLEKLVEAINKGRITTDTVDLISPKTARALAQFASSKEMPKMNVHEIYNISSRRTHQGPTEKSAFSGTRIRAKKLATTVGPAQSRLFVRKIRREGGTVLIDASGSMSLEDSTIIAVAEALPMGTVAYYSADDDSVYPGCSGDLVIYADKGKRYNPLGKDKTLPLHHSGNLIDLMAMQWLLKQPGPRYLVSDGGWTGSKELQQASSELASNAAGRRLFKWHKNLGSLLKDLNIDLGSLLKNLNT